MTVWRNGVGVLRMKVRDRDRDNRLTDLDRHQLRVIHVADVLLRVCHQRDEITARIVPVRCWREGQGLDVFAGEQFRLQGFPLCTLVPFVVNRFFMFTNRLFAMRRDDVRLGMSEIKAL